MNNHKGKTYYEVNELGRKHLYIFQKIYKDRIKMTLFMESVKIFVLIWIKKKYNSDIKNEDAVLFISIPFIC